MHSATRTCNQLNHLVLAQVMLFMLLISGDIFCHFNPVSYGYSMARFLIVHDHGTKPVLSKTRQRWCTQGKEYVQRC